MTREFEIKQKAIELRKTGKSYNFISKSLGVAKSTLSKWFKQHIENHETLTVANTLRNRRESKERFDKYLKDRKQLHTLKYEGAIASARKEFEIYKNEPLFTAALMLYAEKGDKATRHRIRLTNTDWRIHEVFIQFLERYLGFSREKISIQVVAYPEHAVSTLVEYWAFKLNILTMGQFHKTHILQGESKKRLQYGVCMSIINNTQAKYKLIEWIDLYLNSR